jgi:hypothetical protein
MTRPSLLIVTSLLLAAATPVAAQSATQLVRFRVVALQQAAVQQPSAAMVPRAGASATSMGSYGLATNETNRKISASLDQAMPNGSSLVVTMAAPVGGRSTGDTTLGTVDTDVVTAIPASESRGLPVRYTVRAPVGLRGPEQRTVTYTITEAP